MRDFNRTAELPQMLKLKTMIDRHKMMLRRTVNRNAHIITPHGKMMAGRKGRNG